MRFSRWIALMFAVTLMPIGHALNLGAIGPTYPIGENSALDLILKKLRDKARSGELKRIQEAAIRRSMSGIKNMKPVQGIVTATERAQRVIDPSVTIVKAVTTDDGRIVIPAGTRINPLEILPLSKRLVFFDGRDPAQCKAVGKLIAQSHTKIKPILVAGSWLELTKAWKTQVYYDQQGVLSQRFGIRAVPSIIRQQHNTLLLEEIPPKELR